MHVQIVKFRLKSVTSRKTFLELTKQMIAWLKERDGFVAYELYEGREWWSDRITWESEQHAQDGLKAFLTTKSAQQMITLVEDDYSSFFGEVVAECPPLQKRDIT